MRAFSLKEQPFREIEEIITRDEGQRGISKHLNSYEDYYQGLKSLYKGERILIITGFTVPKCQVGESDGPLGSIALAKALEDLNKEVLIVTDEYSRKILEGLKKIKEISGAIYSAPLNVKNKELKKILEAFNPTHLLAIERPGKGISGRYHSMRGEDITDYVADLDPLMDMAKEQRITTLAIGDGGNEMGMGKIRKAGIPYVDQGKKIFATSSADYLIVAGVSNWGAYGLVAGLSLLSDMDLLQEGKEEVYLLKALTDLGGVDGCSKQRALTVDGLSLGSNLNLLLGLKQIIQKNLSR
ncbi:DUF4392 domain-containing protein [Isachenkonia alkalipeptolytica]|nr:DUF4392 domain-containing protein [Isachenkonia alkalipeptolytica]